MWGVPLGGQRHRSMGPRTAAALERPSLHAWGSDLLIWFKKRKKEPRHLHTEFGPQAGGR